MAGRAVRAAVRATILLVLCAPVAAMGQAQSSIAEIKAAIRSHQYDRALSLARQQLRSDPGNFRLWTLEGIVLSMSGRNADALAAYSRALKLSPDDPAALRGEAQILYEAGDAKGIPVLERILKANPGDATAHEMLAVLQAKKGDCQAALPNFAVSEKSAHAHPASLVEWGRCLMQNQRPQEAVAVFRQLSALEPEQAWAQYDLAVALVDEKQYAAAVKVLEPLLTNQTDPDILSLAAAAYEATGETPKAVKLQRQAIVESPANPDYYIGFAELCLNHDAFQVGIDMINVGLRRINADPALYISRGLLYAHLAQYDKAEADFREAERLDSRQSLGAYAIDLTDLQRNKSDATLGKIRAQLQEHPDSPLLNYLLAKLLWSQGNQAESPEASEAMQYAQRAVKLKPDMTEARNLLADLYLASSQYAAAIEQSQQVLREDPASQTAVYHLIVALRHSPRGPERDKIPELVKRLAELQQKSLQQETDRKSFRFVEQKAAP